jgi:hypothetical protein
MNSHYRTLPAVTGASSILMIAAFLAVAGGLPSRVPATIPDGAAAFVEGKSSSDGHEAALLQDATSRDNALQDMRAYGTHRLGIFTEVPVSFGGTSQWSPDWRLQWLDVEHDGEVVRIYHATEVRHPQNRFTAIWQNGHAEWEHVAP